MKLLMFGGTFDPPHIGHISILQNAIQVVKPDEVWVMPAGIPPHKQASTTPALLRLEMCECFRPLFATMQISDWEIQNAGKSYTLKTLQWLKAQQPNAELYLCIGSDMLLSFTTWHLWQDVLQMAALVVQSRAEDDTAKLKEAKTFLEEKGGQIILVDAPIKEISSSELRATIKQGKAVFDYIPPMVMQIIEDNGLYSS